MKQRAYIYKLMIILAPLLYLVASLLGGRAAAAVAAAGFGFGIADSRAHLRSGEEGEERGPRAREPHNCPAITPIHEHLG